MKKVLVGLLVITSVFLLAGCNKEKEKAKQSLVGSWKHSSGYVYTFNKDNTGTYGYGDSKMEFTYEDKEDSVEILYKGNSVAVAYKYKIEGNKLIIKDSLDNDVEYVKQ